MIFIFSNDQPQSQDTTIEADVYLRDYDNSH
jgi:hypothetical protein